MPWLVFVLLVANIALGGYLIAADPSESGSAQTARELEINADRVTIVPPARVGQAQPAEGSSSSRTAPESAPAPAPASDPAAPVTPEPQSVTDPATAAAPSPNAEPDPATTATQEPKPAAGERATTAAPASRPAPDPATAAAAAPKPVPDSATTATPVPKPAPDSPVDPGPAPKHADPAAMAAPAPKPSPGPAIPPAQPDPDLSAAAKPTPQPAPAPAQPAPAATPVCLEWGTFSVAELERVRAELAALGAGRTIVREAGYEPAWWVHVPPLPSRAQAQRLAREIQAAGVSDVHVVAEGERWRNAISLGIYKSQEAANARLARMRDARVVNATVAQRNDLLRLGAIVIVVPDAQLSARIGELRAAYPGAEQREVPCPAEVP